ncbi:MAG: hypothetical protein KAI83_02495 [Thiomargarita sp.]|nr:hypothetical protein [Thiomargarita sp.]
MPLQNPACTNGIQILRVRPGLTEWSGWLRSLDLVSVRKLTRICLVEYPIQYIKHHL